MSAALQLVPRDHNRPIDPIFPDKEDVRPGTVFRYCGANSDKGTLWEVAEIRTLLRKNSDWTEETAEHVRIQGDILELIERKTGRRHTLSFVYMRYSAAWRIETRFKPHL